MNAASSKPTLTEVLRSYPFRLALYFVITLVAVELTFAAARICGPHVVAAENGPLETAQVFLAVIGAVGLLCAARWSRIGRAAFFTCGGMLLYAAARESDRWFETLLFDDAYKWVVGLPVAVLCARVIFVQQHRWLGDAINLMRHPAATLFAVAGFYLCFVCQVLDRPDMWLEISDSQEMQTTKAMIEEFAELFAYLLLAFSGIEAAIVAHRGRNLGVEDKDLLETDKFPRIAA